MTKDVFIDRTTFFMGIFFAITVVLVGYYAINKYLNKNNSYVNSQQPVAAQPTPQIEKSPFVTDILNDQEAMVAMNSNGSPKVILVHAPWCGHCRNMMGAFVQAAAMEPQISWMRADGNVAPSYVRRDDLKGFPTIYGLTSDGTVSQYTGARDVNSLLAFSKTLFDVVKKYEKSEDVEEEPKKDDEIYEVVDEKIEEIVE
jgi:thioredoxin-like negative regulator of GroEL